MKKITHGSTFSGIGAPEIAAEMLGWKNAFHCEINDFGRKVLDYHFPESESYEDITKQDFSKWRGKITVLTGGFPCFAAGTPVLTDKGFLPIQDVRAGMNVLTKDGRYHEVQCVMSHDSQEIVEMRAQGMWKNLETTPNHRFFVMRKKTSGGRNEYESPEWIEIGSCKKGDRIAYPVHDGNNMSHDNAFWKLIGLWLADGWTCTSKRKDRINSYNHKTIICCGHGNVERMKNTIEAAGFNYTLSKNKTTYNAIICDKELSDFLSCFGKYAHGKHLAPECFTLDRERKKSLLEGWFADGYKDRNGSVKITTVSELLALDMAQIARDAYNCPVSISRKTTRRKCIIEGREVNERPQYCVTISNSMRYGEYENGLLWCNIKNIEKKKKEIKVYNLSVNEEQSYTVYGIAVHNCQPFSYAGKRRGTEDDRYLWPYMLKCIQEVRPTWFVGENVAGITTMVFPGEDVKVGSQTTILGENDHLERRERYVIEEICQQLEDIGYSVQPMLIPACAVGAPHRRDRVFFIAHRNDDAEDTIHSGLVDSEYDEQGRERNIGDAGARGAERICGKEGTEMRPTPYPSCSGSGAQEPCGATEINGSDGYTQPSERRQPSKRTDGLSAVQGTDTHPDNCIISGRADFGASSETRGNTSRESAAFFGEGNGGKSDVADTRCTELQAGLDERSNGITDRETSGRSGRGNRIDDEGTRTDADTENLQRNGCGTGERYDVGTQSTKLGDNRKSAVEGIEILYPENRWRTFPTVSPVYRGNDGLQPLLDYIAVHERGNRMDRDSIIDGAIKSGRIEVDFETGKIYSTRIRGREGERIELQGSDCNGYIVHTLSFDGRKKQCRAHQIVWIAANGMYDKSLFQIDHINRDKKDNRLCNLRLVTPKENIDNSDHYANEHILTEEEGMRVCEIFWKGGTSMNELAEDFGVSKSTIFNVIHRFPDLAIPFSRWKKESLKAYGNAIVVQVMYEIFRVIDEIENNR